MTGIPPRNLSEYRPQLRPAAAPTDPFVSPGVQGPALVDYSKLSSISPTLASMFNNMQNQAEKAVGEAVENNKTKIYTLTAKQSQSALLDPSSQEVADFMKAAGVEAWHNPIARERTIKMLTGKVYAESGVLPVMKSTKVQEAIARARMEAGPSEVAKQQAGMEKALELAGPAYEDLVKDLDSTISKGAFAELLQASALEANESAQQLSEKLHRRDVAESLYADIEKISILGQDLDALNPQMMKGFVKSFADHIRQLKKENPTYNIKEMALDALEAQIDTVARSYGLKSPQLEAVIDALDYLADEPGGVLATEDNKLDGMRIKAEAEITRRENREQSAEGTRARQNMLEKKVKPIIQEIMNSSEAVSREQAYQMLMGDDSVKAMVADNIVLLSDVDALARTFSKKASNPETEDLRVSLLSDINNGKLTRVMELIKGNGSDKDKAAWDSMETAEKMQLMNTAYKERDEMYKDATQQVSARLKAMTAPMMSVSNTPVSERYNAQVEGMVSEIMVTSKQLIDDGVPVEEVLKSAQGELERRSDQFSQQIAQRANRATTWTTVSNSDDFKQAVANTEKQLSALFADQKLETGEKKAPDAVAISNIMQASQDKIRRDMQDLMFRAVHDLRQDQIPLEPDEVSARVSQYAAKAHREYVAKEIKNYERKLSQAAAAAKAPDLMSYHESNPVTRDSLSVTGENNMVLSEVLTAYRGEDADGAEEYSSAVFLDPYQDTQISNRRKRLEDQASTRVLAAYDKAAQSPGAVKQEDKEALRVGIYLYGLDERAIQEGAFPSGVSISSVFSSDQDWRREINPASVLMVNSSEELDSIMEKYKDPEGPQPFKNIGYNLSDTRAAASFFKGQSALLESQKGTPKALKNIVRYRKEILKW